MKLVRNRDSRPMQMRILTNIILFLMGFISARGVALIMQVPASAEPVPVAVPAAVSNPLITESSGAAIVSTPIFISIDDSLARDLVLSPTQWFFPGMDWPATRAKMREIGVPGLDSLRACAEQTEEGTVVTPTYAMLLNLGKVRAPLYAWLAAQEGNPDITYPLCFREDQIPVRFRGIKPETLEEISRLFYEAPMGRVYLSDAGTACAAASQTERIGLIRAFSRQETLLLSVRIDNKTDIEKLGLDWHLHNLSRDYMPLLRSVQESGKPMSLDLLHFLPRFVKGFAYTYPADNMPNVEVPKDCVWTAFSFYSEDINYALSAQDIERIIAEHFELLPPGADPDFGDLLVYFNVKGVPVHVAVQLTPNVVFTKNGASRLSPWIFQKRSTMEELYPQVDPSKVRYFRNVSTY